MAWLKRVDGWFSYGSHHDFVPCGRNRIRLQRPCPRRSQDADLVDAHIGAAPRKPKPVLKIGGDEIRRKIGGKPDFQRAAKIAILAKLRGSQPLVEPLCTKIAAEASADTLPRKRQYRSSIGLPSPAQGSPGPRHPHKIDPHFP